MIQHHQRHRKGAQVVNVGFSHTFPTFAMIFYQYSKCGARFPPSGVDDFRSFLLNIVAGAGIVAPDVV